MQTILRLAYDCRTVFYDLDRVHGCAMIHFSFLNMFTIYYVLLGFAHGLCLGHIFSFVITYGHVWSRYSTNDRTSIKHHETGQIISKNHIYLRCNDVCLFYLQTYMLQSMNTILILSPEHLDSFYCKYETNLAMEMWHEGKGVICLSFCI